MSGMRTALVTGASRGIGRATAVALAEQGVQVHAVARSGDALAALSASHAAVRPYVIDLGNADAVDTMMQALLAQGPIDILVNNAGVFPLAPITGTAVSQFAATIDANLVAPFRLLQAVLPHMISRGTGHIVTIGSVADRRIFPGNGAYSASKFGARALHEVLREEVQGTGVRATLVAPAATDTSIWDPVDPDNTPGFPPRAAMLRPEDVADAVCWAVTRPPHVNVDELRISRS
jgi:NADP-dependent 3-hydroxy acid dehydrogenase YdfG